MTSGRRSIAVSCPELRWLLVIVQLAVLVTGCEPVVESGPEAQSEPRHLILITVDTWRGDHFLSERAGVPLTPNLAEFAQKAVRFANASSVATATSPGVAGILTGLLPGRSGVLTNPHMLPESLPVLATALQQSGFVTAAFVANPVLGPDNGFERGFARYQLLRKKAPLRKARGEQVTTRAIEWLDSHTDEGRIFLWLHYMDPHGPYQPPPEYRSDFPVDAFGAPWLVSLLPSGDQSGQQGIPHYQQYGMSPPTRDVRDYLARYAAEVKYMDHSIGELLGQLEQRKFMRDAVVVMTSDHGEALADDHGFYFSHAKGLTQDQIHVPLALYYPGCDAGSVVERPVSTMDILPTVLARLGLPQIENLDGADLLGDEPTEVVSQSPREIAIREGSWKFRWTQPHGFQLIDLATDPGELNDVSLAHPERFDDMKDRLGAIRRRPALAESVTRKRLSKERRKVLRSLGYL